MPIWHKFFQRREEKENTLQPIYEVSITLIAKPINEDSKRQEKQEGNLIYKDAKILN